MVSAMRNLSKAIFSHEAVMAVFAAIVSLSLFWAAPAGAAEGGSDTAAIAKIIKSTWETPEKRIDVSPVVQSHDYAVAGWVQGDRGGRALLKKADGRWSVLLCSGDGIRSAEGLSGAGLPANIANDLAGKLAREEARLPAGHVAKFSLFEAGVQDAPAHHPHH